MVRAKLQLLSFAILAAGGSVCAIAQPPSSADPAQGSTAVATPHVQLQEVVVTAQRREQNLQNVPVSVAVVTPSMITNEGVSDTEALGEVVPGLAITRQGSGATPFLRGVGSPDGTAGSASEVGVYVDGIYMAAQSAEFLSFTNDIKSIQVLKGPQGTLFGENTTGGAILITTKDPSKTPSADISVGFGNYRTFSESLYATTGLTENSAINVSAFSNDSLDGWGRNLVTGHPTYQNQDWGVRSKFLWTPDAATEIRLSADVSRSISGLGISTMIIPGALSFDGVSRNEGFYNVTTSVDPFITQQLWGVALNAQHDFGWARLASISSYREETTFYRFDYAGIPIKIVDADDYNPQHDISQEFHLESLPGSRIPWIVGLFYLRSDGIRSDLYTGSAYPAPDYFYQGGYVNSSYAAFSQTTVPLIDDTNLTLGARATKDERQADAFHRIGGGAMFN